MATREPEINDLRNIYQRLNNVMQDVSAVAKSERNQAQNFSFRGIDAVVNAVSPVLKKHGVIVVPILQTFEYGTILVGKEQKPVGHARVTVEYKFWGPDGDSVSAVVAAESMDSGDKATAKAMSVAFRTALLQTLALPTDDKDADHDTYERSAPAPARVVDPDPLVSEENKQRIMIAFADIGIDLTSALTLAGIRFDEWDRLREKGRVRLLEAFTKAKNEIPPDPSAHMDKPRVATVTPIIQPVPDEVKAAHPSNGGKGDVSAAQLNALKALFRGGAYSEDEQLQMASNVALRVVGAFEELSKKEASALITILKAPKADEPEESF